MAEPLLKRTFSRLRGKDRSRRKTDPKLSDVSVKSDSVQTWTSSPSTTTTRVSAGHDPHSPPCSHITVTKRKQRVTTGKPHVTSHTVTTASLHSSSIPRHIELTCPSRTSQDAPGMAWNQSVVQAEQSSDRMDRTTPPSVSVGSVIVHQGASELTWGSTDIPPASISAKRSGQHAYLQSLDRSSRAWVLSSGKPQPSEDVSPRENSGSIWYNPIPEDDDAESPQIWRRRDKLKEEAATKRECPGDTSGDLGGLWVWSTEDCGSECPLECNNPGLSLQIDNVSAENTDDLPSHSSPTLQKKGSVIDRLRSPGTVRKLSLKMKKLPELRRKLSLRSASRAHRQGNINRGGGDDWALKNVTSPSELSNQTVISRYHLDSSAPSARSLQRPSRGRAASKGGHLSDGDSPELLPRQQPTTSQETACSVSSFRLYLGTDPPRCNQRVTGLLTIHLVGLEEMKTSRPEGSKKVFLAIQVDGVTRARTALLSLQGATLPLNHTFHLELERARQLRIVVLTPSNPQPVGRCEPEWNQRQTTNGPSRNRVCCLGGVSIPPLFKGSRSQQLCVKLEPKGLLYVRLSLQEKWDTQSSRDTSAPAHVFGVELHRLVEKEGSETPVPLLIQKSVAEIERRGLKVVGLYRLCGSAAVKKELRDWFERNSPAVCLSEDLYPDINVITGILKDYLRELPSPLITKALYQVVREAMTLQPLPAAPVTHDPPLTQRTLELLSCLPPPEKATLSLLLDHLSLVASFSSYNRMTQQNLAVCFGPVLLTPTQEAWKDAGDGGGSRGGKRISHGERIMSSVDFKQHIEALHYLLQQWPVPTHQVPTKDYIHMSAPPLPTHQALCLQQQHPAANTEGEVVVSLRDRGGLARLESPPLINRYAGDWSICGHDFLSEQEADYDEVAGSDSDAESDDEEEKKVWSPERGGGLYVDDFMDAPFNCRLSLKDFDTLIHDLDRELAKQINMCL